MGLGRDRRVNHRRNICPPVGWSPCVVYEWADWRTWLSRYNKCGLYPAISRTPNLHPIACGIRAHTSLRRRRSRYDRGASSTIAHTSCAVSRFSLRLKSSWYASIARFIRSGQGYTPSSYGRCVNVRSEMTDCIDRIVGV